MECGTAEHLVEPIVAVLLLHNNKIINLAPSSVLSLHLLTLAWLFRTVVVTGKGGYMPIAPKH